MVKNKHINIIKTFFFQIFRVFDINNDGTVSQKELQRIVKDLFHLFKKDENTDKLNKDNLAEEAFKEMDANTGKYEGAILMLNFVKLLYI